MLGLFLSEVILFAAAALIGFAAGWRIRTVVMARRNAETERDIEALRVALSDAQVRRARIS